MEDSKNSLIARQDRLLQQLQQAAIPVAIYLKNGIRLQGEVVGFDSHILMLRSPITITQMIYKQAVLSIQPQ